MATKDELRDGYSLMRAAFPRWAQSMDTTSVRHWGSMLEDIPEGRLVPALRRLAMSSKWPPQVSEIREAAGMKLDDDAILRHKLDHTEALKGKFGPEAKRLAIEHLSDAEAWHRAYKAHKDGRQDAKAG